MVVELIMCSGYFPSCMVLTWYAMHHHYFFGEALYMQQLNMLAKLLECTRCFVMGTSNAWLSVSQLSRGLQHE